MCPRVFQDCRYTGPGGIDRPIPGLQVTGPGGIDRHTPGLQVTGPGGIDRHIPGLQVTGPGGIDSLGVHCAFSEQLFTCNRSDMDLLSMNVVCRYNRCLIIVACC